MLVSIVAALIVAGLTGLAFLAYHHPKSYPKVALLAGNLAAAASIGANIWSVALSRAKIAVSDLVADQSALDHAIADLDLGIPYPATTATIFAVYLIVLGVYVTRLKHNGTGKKGIE